MLLAIIGYKPAISSFFNHDKSLLVALYSLSVDNNIFVKITNKMSLINELIATKNNDAAISTDNEENILDELIEVKKTDLLNLIINKFYIPYINSVPFDKRKKVRDDILRGFLGVNFVNLKISDINKDNYYWASQVNNSVPINNKITDQSWTYFREQVILKNDQKMNDIYVKNSLSNSKSGIKEFWVDESNGKLVINTTKKVIDEKKLVIEMLSYAYLNSINEDFRRKIEDGIVRLCITKKEFTVSLKCNPLSNRMLTAAVIQLASKNGYDVELIKTINNVAYFKIKEPI